MKQKSVVWLVILGIFIFLPNCLFAEEWYVESEIETVNNSSVVEEEGYFSDTGGEGQVIERVGVKMTLEKDIELDLFIEKRDANFNLPGDNDEEETITTMSLRCKF